MKNILKALTLILSVNTAFAVTPENGWWWNPSESGRGFNIETQNGMVFVATFVYDDAGMPIWYSGAGKLDGNSAVSTNLQVSQNGPCMACPYQAPVTTDAGIPVSLQFTSRGEGSLIWKGKTIPIQRFNFNLGGGLPGLVGEWVFMPNVPSDLGGYYGDRIVFDHIEENGNISGARVNRPYKTAVASPMDPIYGYSYATVIKSGSYSSLDDVYIFNFVGLNKITGLAAQSIFSASLADQLNDIGREGIPFEGYRITR